MISGIFQPEQARRKAPVGGPSCEPIDRPTPARILAIEIGSAQGKDTLNAPSVSPLSAFKVQEVTEITAHDKMGSGVIPIALENLANSIGGRITHDQRHDSCVHPKDTLNKG
jgi:hypothetical protein